LRISEIIRRDHWEKNVFPGDTKVEIRWWGKTATVTQEERLERAILESIKVADKYKAAYKAQIAAGEAAVNNTEHLITAIKETNKLISESEE
jgi:hypothetical protein